MTEIFERLRAENADLRAEVAELSDKYAELRMQILNFPNLTAMREAMIATADENAKLRRAIEWAAEMCEFEYGCEQLAPRIMELLK